jgi:hypothetical protein
VVSILLFSIFFSFPDSTDRTFPGFPMVNAPVVYVSKIISHFLEIQRDFGWGFSSDFKTDSGMDFEANFRPGSIGVSIRGSGFQMLFKELALLVVQLSAFFALHVQMEDMTEGIFLVAVDPKLRFDAKFLQSLVEGLGISL